jgi:hypothetical protein
MYHALSIFLFAVCNTDVSRTFYININVSSNIYSEILLIDKLCGIFVATKNTSNYCKYHVLGCALPKTHTNSRRSGTQMVDGRVRVAGATLLHLPDATACGLPACGPPSYLYPPDTICANRIGRLRRCPNSDISYELMLHLKILKKSAIFKKKSQIGTLLQGEERQHRSVHAEDDHVPVISDQPAPTIVDINIL